MTQPFRYPDTPHVRRHGPQGYAAAESFRPWLRDEFAFRCVYCLQREVWGTVRAVYALDHFHPVAKHPDAELDYDNLLYACAGCNAAKRDRVIPDPLLSLLSQSS
jgi:5-methylcytosine-specific restriction endonuclease McrA